MIIFLKKISFISWLVFIAVILSIGLVCYTDYENYKWGEDIDSISEKYAIKLQSIRKDLPKGEVNVSGENIRFYLITQKEIDAIQPHYYSGFSLSMMSYMGPVHINSTHNNSKENNLVGIGKNVCYSEVYLEYPATTFYRNKQKISLDANTYSDLINKHCQENGVLENTQRAVIINTLQHLRDTFEANGIDIQNYMDSYPSWKKEFSDIFNFHFYQKDEIFKLIFGGTFLIILIEVIAFYIRRMRRKTL